jgi:hypothetical protein
MSRITIRVLPNVSAEQKPKLDFPLFHILIRADRPHADLKTVPPACPMAGVGTAEMS